jgi:adenine/guanine phosphoribosyltransferase-like PRPP-binding protein
VNAIAALRDIGVAPDTYGPSLNTAVSPGAVDIIAEALADSLSPTQPHAVVVWNTSDECVLAHAVARRLGVSVLRACEVEGLLSLDRDPPPDARLALLATQWSTRRLTALRNLVAARGGQSVAVAAALGSPALTSVRDLPVQAIVDATQTAEFGA